MEQKTYSVYKVFLASSNELADDRKHFDDYIHKINHVLNGLGYHIEVVQWEFLDPAMPDDGRSQDEYNRQLKDCDECIVLFWHKLGKYTKEELDTAYKEKYSDGRLSRLTVYFKDSAPGSITPELQLFWDQFPQIYNERYPSSYRSIESVESDFLLYFVQREGITTSARVTLNDSKILLNGKPVGEISKMSLTYGNKPYQQLLNDVAELEQGLQSAKGTVRLALNTALEGKRKELQEMEEKLFAIAQTIMRITIDDPDDEQVRQAKAYAAEGNLKEALALLGEDELIAEAKRWSALEAAVKNKQRVSVEKIVLRIQLLSAAKSDNTWVQQCINLYRQAVAFARPCYAPFDLASLIFSQATFLQENNQFKEAEEAYQEVLAFFRQQGELPNVATTLNNLAILHRNTHDFKAAEDEYQEALAKYRELAKNAPEAYLPDVAMTLNNLANLHRDTHDFKAAEKEYQEALEIYKELARTTPEAYLPYVATTLNNLAVLHYYTHDFKAAEEEYQKALGIRRELAKTTPKAYLPDVATTLNNLALLHSSTHYFKAAEEEYQEVLAIYRELAKTTPEAYLPNVAATLNNLAALHSDTDDFEAAEEEYQKALDIRRELAKTTPEAYLPDVAMTLNNLANLHRDTHDFRAAEKEYREALAKYRGLARTTPEAYLPNVANTLNNLANLHNDTDDFEAAEKEYQKALGIRRELAKNAPEAYLPDVAMTLYNMAILFAQQKQYGDAEKAAEESLAINQQMAQKSESAFGSDVKNAQQLLDIIRIVMHFAKRGDLLWAKSIAVG